MLIDAKKYRDYEDDSCAGVRPPDSFEGLWVEYWTDGSIKYRGHFKKRRMRIGQHLLFWSNGYLQELSYWVEGWLHGTLQCFRENGSILMETDYEDNGARTRSWTQRTYNTLGKLERVEIWKNHEQISDWRSPELAEHFKRIKYDETIAEALRMMEEDDSEEEGA